MYLYWNGRSENGGRLQLTGSCYVPCRPVAFCLCSSNRIHCTHNARTVGSTLFREILVEKKVAVLSRDR